MSIWTRRDLFAQIEDKRAFDVPSRTIRAYGPLVLLSILTETIYIAPISKKKADEKRKSVQSYQRNALSLITC